MLSFSVYMNCSGGVLHYLGEVEALDRSAALADLQFAALPQHLLFTFQRELSEESELDNSDYDSPPIVPDVRKSTPPSGRECRGVSFKVIADDTTGALAEYRRCGWDGELTGPKVDGEPCQSCARRCTTVDLGIVDSSAARACYAWLPNYNMWQLCPLP